MRPRSDRTGAPSRATLSILFALGERSLHGYGIMKEVKTRTGGRVTLLPGSLYATLKRMLQEGWVEEVDGDPSASGPGRPKRHYRLTAEGRALAAREAERMVALLQLAGSTGVPGLDALPDVGS